MIFECSVTIHSMRQVRTSVAHHSSSVNFVALPLMSHLPVGSV